MTLDLGLTLSLSLSLAVSLALSSVLSLVLLRPFHQHQQVHFPGHQNEVRVPRSYVHLLQKR